jgi:hypothetical protein
VRFFCDAPGGYAWFRFETEAEAEAKLMRHAVDKHFARCVEAAKRSYKPPEGAGIERDIGLKGHIQRSMPRFLALRDGEGGAWATAMIPPERPRASVVYTIIIVGPGNKDPYPTHAQQIEALATHLSIPLPREKCFPYA